MEASTINIRNKYIHKDGNFSVFELFTLLDSHVIVYDDPEYKTRFITFKNSENGNYLVEVGETIIPTWKTTFNAGSYTYGPATGVTPIQAKVYLSTNSNSSSTIGVGEMNEKTGNLSVLTVNDTSTKHYAKVDYGWT
jgi:hypothetical protein